jgi:Ca2+-binding EF-hand superfamily protein
MNLGEKLTEAEIEELIREADKNKDEKIDYDRFFCLN